MLKCLTMKKEELLGKSINSQILRLSFPTMIGLFLQALYDLVDMIWIGFIDPAAVAAATLFNTFFWMIEVLNEIVGTSSVALISQGFGANDKEKTQSAMEQTLLFKFLLAIIGALLLFFTLPSLFDFFSKDPKVKEYGLSYGYIRVFFIPFFFSSFSVNTIFRCTNDAKTPMKLLIMSAVINMIADPILMFETIPMTNIRGFNLGIKGAAIATVFSITLSFVLGFILLLKRKNGPTIKVKKLFKFDWKIDKKLFLIGLPSGINVLLRNFANMIFLKLVAGFGTEAVAVAGIGFRLYSFVLMPIWGLMMGSGIVVGHNLGANLIEKAKSAVKITTIDALIVISLLTIPIMVFPSAVLSLFLGGRSVGYLGISLMRIVGPALLVAASMSGIGSAFTGSGQNRPLLVASFIGQYLVLIPYSLIITSRFNLPIGYLWFALLLGDIVEFIVIFSIFKNSKWYAKRV